MIPVTRYPIDLLKEFEVMRAIRPLSYLSHAGVVSIVFACLLTVLVAASAQVVSAQTEQSPAPAQTDAPPTQEPAATAQPETSASPSIARMDDRYRIGPGDVLDIRVFNRPQLSREAVRVDQAGLIQMPLLEEDIKAACLTESELAKEIARLYLKYQRHPYVNVFIKEYSSTPVAVIGAVDKPGRFQLQKRVRLLELLAFAGGQTDKAGSRVQLARTGSISTCDAPAGVATVVAEDQSETVYYFDLKDTLRGDAKANPFIRPGDVVNLPEADEAYVIGNVFKPTVITLKEPITVSQAIAKAGGTLPATKSDGIRILRQKPGSTEKTIIAVDLGAIKKQRAEDVALQANDIIEVPTSSGKKFFNSILGAITPAFSNLPVYILR
jgi:polysaccharide biosynthesis/export protein